MAQGRSTPRQRRVIYAITERPDNRGDVKTFWTAIGSAFTNDDGSITLLFDALPVSGKAQVRTPRERTNERD